MQTKKPYCNNKGNEEQRLNLVGCKYRARMETKICKDCQQSKPIAEYIHDKSMRVYKLCRPCQYARYRAYYYANKERIIRKRQEEPDYHAKIKETYQKRKDKHKAYYQANKERIKERQRMMNKKFANIIIPR